MIRSCANLVLGLLLCTSATSATGKKTFKIGVITWSAARSVYEIPRLKMVDQLKDEGFGEAELIWHIEGATGSKEKAEAAIQKLRAVGVDAFVAVGTNSALPLAK